MEQDSVRFLHATQNNSPFKTYEFFLSWILHLVFLDHGRLWVMETEESKIVDKRGLLCVCVAVQTPQKAYKGLIVMLIDY